MEPQDVRLHSVYKEDGYAKSECGKGSHGSGREQRIPVLRNHGGLSEIVLEEFMSEKRVFIATGYTDLRRGIDGLAAMVSEEFGLDPVDEAVFLFCGRRADRIKCLWWEPDGFVLACKRLEGAGSFKWPRSQREAKALTGQQVRWLLEGLETEQKKAIQPAGWVSLF